MTRADAGEKEVAQFARRGFDNGRLRESHEDRDGVHSHQQADGREDQGWPCNHIVYGQVLFFNGDTLSEVRIGNLCFRTRRTIGFIDGNVE